MKESFHELNTPLERFRKEIQALKEAEQRERKTAHFAKSSFSPELDPNQLTEEDMRAWETFKRGALSHQAFEEYRNAISDDEVHRGTFSAFLANKLM